MPRLSRYSLLAFVAFFAAACNSAPLVVEDRDRDDLASTVLLVSLDGFHPDYLTRFDAPTLTRLAEEGVRAEYMEPSFPTKTFPNHYTLVTGLYPAHHGIVSNTMYDPVFDARFSLSNRQAVGDRRWWDDGEPIWVTSQKQGQSSAPYFWPGSEAAIQGVRPSYWMPYNNSMPGVARINSVIAALQKPAPVRPTFLTLYLSNVDNQGHRHGPYSEEVGQAVAAVDGLIETLVERLRSENLMDQINLIITSDHGMAATSRDSVAFLDDYVGLDNLYIIDYDPVAMIRPEPAILDSTYQQLRNMPHVSFYKKEDIPEALHYSGHRRIPPLVGIADDGWRISTREYYNNDPSRYDGGTHGYDNHLPSMRALFIARGPAFKQQPAVEPFANIHVYELMASILGVDPAPNDGDLAAVQHLLK